MIPIMLPSGGNVSGFNPNSGSNTYVDAAVQDAIIQQYNPVAQAEQGKISGDAMSQLHALAMNNPDYMESYLKALLERENTIQAQNWYEKLSNSSYSRAMEDIKRAGYNPYLAISGLSGAGSGSPQPAGSGSVSGAQIASNRRGQDLDVAGSVLKVIASIAGIAAMIALAA